MKLPHGVTKIGVDHIDGAVTIFWDSKEDAKYLTWNGNSWVEPSNAETLA
jgi:hypothetical protein